MSSNPIIPKAKDISQNEYTNSKLPEALPDNFIRSLTAGNRQHKNIMNGVNGIKCDERKIDENDSSLVNYPSTVPNIVLVQKIIDYYGYFTESIKRELHFIITEWNNCNRNYFHLNIALERYQKIFNITSKEEARKRIKTTVKVLISCSIVIFNDNKSNYSATNIPIFKDIHYKRNIIIIVFSEDFSDILKGVNSSILINQVVYQLPLTAFFLYLRLMNHKKMNVNKYNENIISVSSLLESCTSLPSEEKIEEDLTNRIKKPFEKGMERLEKEEILKEWYYCRSDGNRLSEKELREERFLYKKFKTYHVKYTMNNNDEIRKVYLKSLKNKKNYQDRVKNRKKITPKKLS